LNWDWNAIGAIGELAGAVGVVVSLLYLATQIRQNTRSNRIAAKQTTTNQFETGAIGPDEWWESLYLIRHSWICHPGVQQWWQQYRDGTSPPFRRFLDAEVGALSENSSREQ
jgi:hypothetical protein